jgi:hypothetical protein
MAKHRKKPEPRHRKKPDCTYVKKAAIVGAATVTVSALTAGMVPAPETGTAENLSGVKLAATTGPDYTALIADSSNSLDNILIILGNVGGAATGIYNATAIAIPGGLLPTFTASRHPALSRQPGCIGQEEPMRYRDSR